MFCASISLTPLEFVNHKVTALTAKCNPKMYLIVFSEVFSFSIKHHRKLKAVFSFLQLKQKIISIFFIFVASYRTNSSAICSCLQFKDHYTLPAASECRYSINV